MTTPYELDRLRDQHKGSGQLTRCSDGKVICDECEELWPCPTARVIQLAERQHAALREIEWSGQVLMSTGERAHDGSRTKERFACCPSCDLLMFDGEIHDEECVIGQALDAGAQIGLLAAIRLTP